MEYTNITEIKRLNDAQFIEWFKPFLIDFALKFGQEFTDGELNYLCINLTNYLRSEYPSANLGNIKYIFERGLEGKYDTSSRINYRILLRWIVKGKDEIFKPKKSEDLMTQKEMLVRLWKMADERESKTGKPNPFRSCLERLAGAKNMVTKQ